MNLAARSAASASPNAVRNVLASFASQSASPPTFVSPEWLSLALDSSKTVKVLDVSWHLPGPDGIARNGAAEWETKHIPGSHHLNIDLVADTSSSLPHMMPTPEEFAKAMESFRIAPTDHVVLYDAHGLFATPRVWWMFKSFGHEKVSILKGGLPAWEASGLHLTSSPSGSSKSSETGSATQEYATPALRQDAVATKSKVVEVSDALDGELGSHDGYSEILDARPPGRFSGDDPEPRPGLRQGHIPGSTSVPAGALAQPGFTELKERDELEGLFRQAGVDLEGLRDGSTSAILSCGSGVTACHIVLALHELGVDLTNLSVYDGSFAEWGQPDAGTKVNVLVKL